MVPEKLFNEWLKKADEDFGFACSNLESPVGPYHAQVCFHFQQAAEKYLKAYIVANSLEFKKIHDLTELLNICGKENQLFSDLEEECNFLTDFYVDTRYPVHWPAEINRDEAVKAQTACGKIRDFVVKSIKD